MRIPKEGFFAHQVIWDGWVDVERPRIHIIGHWNYTAGTSKLVTVVSSADAVELFLNGKSLGRGVQDSRFLFTFAYVGWQPGELTAVGYAADGTKLATTTIKTAGEPASLRLTTRTGPGGLRADGTDMALVEVEVVDAAGQRNPVALDTVDFTLDGPAEWRGGIAQGPDNFILAKSLPVEGGVNRVLVRSLPQAGTITLTARAKGMAPATIELRSHAVKVAGGLGTQFAADSLASSLDRGPTPAGPSYKATRRSVDIIGVNAGSNAEQAGRSFDDNETTAWTSSPGRDNAWVEYELAHPATLTEASFKLAGWRERSYPVRILVDGQEVFRGDTPRSLGYVTLPLKPVAGKKVRVELLGNATEKDEMKLVEVADQKNTDTGANRAPKGVLAIVEAEFYEAVQ
jgi:beta-galactosidase